MAAKRKNWHAAHAAELTFGQRVADSVAAAIGSWSFIIAQSVVLAVWLVVSDRVHCRIIFYRGGFLFAGIPPCGLGGRSRGNFRLQIRASQGCARLAVQFATNVS